MPDSANTDQLKDETVQFILTVHDALTDIFFDPSAVGDAYNRYQFYAMRHKYYLKSVNWGLDVDQFYKDVANWKGMRDGSDKRRLYAKLVVDAFRLKARTIKFLRERLLTDGSSSMVLIKLLTLTLKTRPISTT